MSVQQDVMQRLLGASYRSRSGEQLIIRHCRGTAELDTCVDLQRLIWGIPDLEITPRKAFLLAQELGGQAIAAFNEREQMVGFVMAMAAIETAPAAEAGRPEPYLHSHMLAVLPEYRNQGLGARLKLAQREDALERGIERMTWTFDPLAAKNAYLNLHRLGAIARRYSPDFYGVSSSRLQSGLPTDRLHAEWWLRSARVWACVHTIVESYDASRESPISAAQEPFGEGVAAEPQMAAESQKAIFLPVDVEQWKQDGSDRALGELAAIQSGNRGLFLKAFGNGLAVTDFIRDAGGNGVFVLEDWHARDWHPTMLLDLERRL